MKRRKFTADERTLFCDGAQVAYRARSGVIYNARIVGELSSEDALDYAVIRIINGKLGVSSGELITVSPGEITFGWV